MLLVYGTYDCTYGDRMLQCFLLGFILLSDLFASSAKNALTIGALEGQK